jgi:MFS family permease
LSVQTDTIETSIPARLDRLPWFRFHWLVVVGLGTVWILDGLEVTMVGSVASRLTEGGSGISINAGQIGTAAAIYVAGACTGALFFGQLTDRFGRKRLFLVTLCLYLTATAATAFAFSAWYFYAARFFTGAGIGGEYAAINSAIDELIPARVRGRVDLIINGSYWLGAAAGAAAAIVLLDENLLAADVGWRIAFGLGVVLGLAILLVRRHVPESPRWLFIHGREEEAEQIVDRIESDVAEETGTELSEPDESIEVRQRESVPFREIAKVAVKKYPARSFLALALFVGQAFIYNGVTFDLGTLYTSFYGISSGFVPVFLIVFAVGNFLGPLTLGRLFDTVGRKPMIVATYLGSAAIIAVTAALFAGSTLSSAWALQGLIVVTFFFASAGASAAYLTASEIFPMETRALAIAFFYACGTAAGGIAGPLLFGHLIDSGSRSNVAIAFWVGAAVMAVGGVAEIFFGVRAEQESLEDIAKPLTAEDAEEGSEDEEGGEDHDQESQARERPEPRRRPREPSREADRRIRERVDRRRRRERAGLGRYRPGLGSSFYSPGMIGTAYRSRSITGELDRNHEIDAIVAALEEHGPAGRNELARLVGARFWGPGRFRQALADAVGEGDIRRDARGSYESARSSRQSAGG